MKRGMRLSAAVVGLLVAMMARAAQADRAPVPGSEQQAKAAKAVDEIFGRELRSARAPEQSRAVARKMVQAAAESNDDPAGRFALLTRARSVAAEAGDVATALAADEQLDREYTISDMPDQRAQVLAQLARTVRPGADAVLLIEKIDEATDSALARDDYEMATRMTDLAGAGAARANVPALVRRAAARAKEVRETSAAYSDARKAIAAVRADPGDRQASLAAGRFLCFMKGNWSDGLVLLRGGADPTLAQLARDELREPGVGAEQVALGDGWWEVSEGQQGVARRQVRAHAVAWYRTALASASGFSKAKAQKRIEEAGGAGEAAWIDLLQGVDPARDAARGTWRIVEGGKLVLTTDSIDQQRIMLPYVARGDYDLSVRFSRTRGSGAVCVYVPAGEGECLIAITGWGSKQLSALFSANFTGPDGASVPNDQLSDGRVYQLDVSVRLLGKNVQITVLRDQQSFMQWRGRQSDLVVPREWALGKPNAFGIGGDNALIVTSAKVRPVGGAAETVR